MGKRSLKQDKQRSAATEAATRKWEEKKRLQLLKEEVAILRSRELEGTQAETEQFKGSTIRAELLQDHAQITTKSNIGTRQKRLNVLKLLCSQRRGSW